MTSWSQKTCETTKHKKDTSTLHAQTEQFVIR